MAPARVAIVGAAGRMGLELLAQAAQMPDDIQIIAAIERPDSGRLGAPLGPQGIVSIGSLDECVSSCDVVIDFSSPSSCLSAARVATNANVRFVSGTTGLDAAQRAEIAQLARQAAILHAANFSVGVNILAHLVELAARATGPGFDLEVFEAHHRRKVDAPSGTALLLGQSAAIGRGLDLPDAATWSRHGHTGAREQDTIGFQVVRGGDIVGEHTVFMCADGERLEFTHRATDRAIFARGALRAARWLVGRRPGLYTMHDVLFGA
jgi:4-hydroxy-tetrahydrodipicolinate reductase